MSRKLIQKVKRFIEIHKNPQEELDRIHNKIKRRKRNEKTIDSF